MQESSLREDIQKLKEKGEAYKNKNKYEAGLNALMTVMDLFESWRLPILIRIIRSWYHSAKMASLLSEMAQDKEELRLVRELCVSSRDDSFLDHADEFNVYRKDMLLDIRSLIRQGFRHPDLPAEPLSLEDASSDDAFHQPDDFPLRTPPVVLELYSRLEEGSLPSDEWGPEFSRLLSLVGREAYLSKWSRGLVIFASLLRACRDRALSLAVISWRGGSTYAKHIKALANSLSQVNEWNLSLHILCI